MAGAAPNALLGYGVREAGDSVGLSPLGERILDIVEGVPGVGLEIIHGISGR
jgi:hypothetical protein